MRRWLIALPLTWLCAAPAAAVLIIDPSQSSLTPSVGAPETLSGTIKVLLGDPLPLVANTTFDVANLSATASGGLEITLDPALASPAAGVLSPGGAFLIPNLFLRLDDGGTPFDLTVPNVTGSYGDIAGCPGSVCLQASFDVDTGGPAGIVSVVLFAVPEPGSAALLGLGLVVLARLRRVR